MIQTGFWIGRRDWWIMASFNISGEKDLNEVYRALMACGCPDNEAQKACIVLSRKNSGYTFTDMEGQYTLMFASKADTPEQLFDTYDHELKHCVEHISSFYGVDSKSETAAYLQGEIAKKMFPAVAIAVCPKCHHEKGEEC
jgi:hypothetical protein